LEDDLVSCSTRTSSCFVDRLKQANYENDHLSQSSAEAKNTWRSTSTPANVVMMWCLIQPMDNSTSTAEYVLLVVFFVFVLREGVVVGRTSGLSHSVCVNRQRTTTSV